MYIAGVLIEKKGVRPSCLLSLYGCIFIRKSNAYTMVLVKRNVCVRRLASVSAQTERCSHSVQTMANCKVVFLAITLSTLNIAFGSFAVVVMDSIYDPSLWLICDISWIHIRLAIVILICPYLFAAWLPLYTATRVCIHWLTPLWKLFITLSWEKQQIKRSEGGFFCVLINDTSFATDKHRTSSARCHWIFF